MTDNPFALDAPVPGVTPAPTGPPMPEVHKQAAVVPVESGFTTDPTAPRPDEDPFSGPAPAQARSPRLRDVFGRLVLIIPHKLEEGIPNTLQPGTTQDRMTADVVILDGGQIEYGGAPEKTPPVPHDKVAQVPHKSPRMFISSVGLISQCREALDKRRRGGIGMVLGRLGVGKSDKPGQNPPYLLQNPTDADKSLARQYLATQDPFDNS